MDWNNNTLCKKLPVTLVYSKALANIIQQNPNMVDSVYDFSKFHVTRLSGHHIADIVRPGP